MGDYTTIRGLKCCTCVAKWFPVFEELAIQKKLVSGKIWLIQATGKAAASAGTHSKGGAMDIGVMSHDLIKLARQMGASASWVRNTGSFANNQHSHLVLEGCPHNSPARYQITAVHNGYNGLGTNGMGGKDQEWRPSSWTTWTKGLSWAQEQLGGIDMAITITDIKNAVADVVDKWNLVTVGDSKWTITHAIDRIRRQGDENIASNKAIRAALDALGAETGVDVESIYKAAYEGAKKGVDDEIAGATVTLETNPEAQA